MNSIPFKIYIEVLRISKKINEKSNYIAKYTSESQRIDKLLIELAKKWNKRFPDVILFIGLRPTRV